MQPWQRPRTKPRDALIFAVHFVGAFCGLSPVNVIIIFAFVCILSLTDVLSLAAVAEWEGHVQVGGDRYQRVSGGA